MTERSRPPRSQATLGDLEGVNYFGDVNFKESSRSSPTAKGEISKKKVATTTLNALHQMN